MRIPAIIASTILAIVLGSIDPKPLPSTSAVRDITPIVEPAPPRKHAVIEFHSGPSCLACVANKQLVPGWKGVGWAVEHHAAEAGQTIPYFYIWINGGKSRRFVGYMSNSALRSLQTELVKKQKARAGIASTVAMRNPEPAATSFVLANGTRPRPSGGHWSYPGGISDHLMGVNHNFTVEQMAGLSQHELESMHDADHERMRGTIVRQPRRRMIVMAGR